MIGPSKQDQPLIQPVQKVTSFVVRTTKNFFERPLYYLFYTVFTALVIGLFFNKEFLPEFYILFWLLGAIEAVRFYVAWKKEMKEQNTN